MTHDRRHGRIVTGHTPNWRPVNRHNGVVWVEAGANTMAVTDGPYADLDIEGD